MKDRIRWDDICMGVAVMLSERATCKTPDRQVGCVIVSPDYAKPIAWGYNGQASGSDADCDYDSKVERGSRCNCAHAEMNALVKLVGEGKDLIMYVTLSPCKLCATLIVNTHRISKVVYLSGYRDEEPLFILRNAGILVEKYEHNIRR